MVVAQGTSSSFWRTLSCHLGRLRVASSTSLRPLIKKIGLLAASSVDGTKEIDRSSSSFTKALLTLSQQQSHQSEPKWRQLNKFFFSLIIFFVSFIKSPSERRKKSMGIWMFGKMISSSLFFWSLFYGIEILKDWDIQKTCIKIWSNLLGVKKYNLSKYNHLSNETV